MQHKKIVIAGGSGFIGENLAKYFANANEVVILSRLLKSPENNRYAASVGEYGESAKTRTVYWDGIHQGSWSNEVNGADLVINLSGKSVNCRYTANNKRKIIASRVQSTAAIGLAIQNAVKPPSLWINLTSATIYRHAEDKPQDELTGEIGDDFSVQVCKQWEESFFKPRTPFTRKVAFRTAVILGAGGVMIPYLNMTRLGLGGPQASGRQMFSWIHIIDVCRAVEFMFNSKELEGIYNLSAPNPVDNETFMKTLRHHTGHKCYLPAYKWMLTLGAIVIGTETELILKSRWVLPTKMTAAGFTFKYPSVYGAVHEIINSLKNKDIVSHQLAVAHA